MFPWQDRPTTLYPVDSCALHPSLGSNVSGSLIYDDNAVPSTIAIGNAGNPPGTHAAIHHWTLRGTGTREGQLIASGGNQDGTGPNVIAAGAAFPVPSEVRTNTWRGSFRVDFWRADGTWQGGGLVVVRRTPATVPLSVIQSKNEFATNAVTGTNPQRVEFSGDYARGDGEARKLRAGDPTNTFTGLIPLLQEVYTPYGTRPRPIFGYFAYGYDDIETARVVVAAHPEITQWQIWNEPDVIGVSPERAASTYLEFHAMVHEENPAAIVRGPAQVTVNPAANQGYSWLQAFIDAGGMAGIDILDEHLYNTGIGSIPTYRHLSLGPFLDLLQAEGVGGASRAVSEFGNMFGDNYGMGTPQDQAARFMAEYFMALELGTTPEDLHIYKIAANGDWDQPSWCMSFWGQKYPALAHFITAGRILDPLDFGTRVKFTWDGPGNDFLVGGRAHVGDGGPGVAWWISDGAEGTFPLVLTGTVPGNLLTVTDADDNDTTVPVIDGVAEVPYTVYPTYASLPAGVTAAPGSLGFGASLTSSASPTVTGGPLAPSVIMRPSQVTQGPYKDKIIYGLPNIADGQSVFQSALTPTVEDPVDLEITASPCTVTGFFIRSGRPWQDIGTIKDADVQLLVGEEWQTVYTIGQDMTMVLTGGSGERNGHSSWFDLLKAWRYAWPVVLDEPVSNVTGMRLRTRDVSRGQGPDPGARNGYGALNEASAAVSLDSVRADPSSLALTRVRFFGVEGGGDGVSGTGRYVYKAA